MMLKTEPTPPIPITQDPPMPSFFFEAFHPAFHGVEQHGCMQETAVLSGYPRPTACTRRDES